jgi:nucleoside-diphosphate-sugar epimerase
MAVLVTGATGFLGGRLAQVLAGGGETVRILARPGRSLQHLAGSPVAVIPGDLGAIESLARAVHGVTHVYHCAACSTDWAPWHLYYEANVDGVKNLLDAAARVDGLQRFLHVSTTDVYGYPAQPCDESHPLTDVGLPYNRTKCQGEEAVWRASRDRGLPVTIVRPATIYGPRSKDFALEIARLIRQGSMTLIDGGRSPGGFCYVDNAVNAIIRAATIPETAGRVYNLADGTGVTWRQYVNALADGLGEHRPRLSLSSTAAFALARASELTYRALRISSRPLLTRHAVYLLSRNQEYPTTRARKEFGFAPAVSFEEGVGKTVEWLKVHAV